MLKKLNLAVTYISYFYVGYIVVDSLLHLGEKAIDRVRNRKSKIETEEKRIETKFKEIVKTF